MKMKVIREISRTKYGWEVKTDEGRHWMQKFSMEIQHSRSFVSKYLLVAYIKAKFSKERNDSTSNDET